MSFLPINTILGTTDEFKNISFTVTYTVTIGGIGGTTTSYPVTLTAINPNVTVSVSGNTITGYYSESFVNSIEYRTKDNQFVNVQKFNQIDKTELSEIIHYFANTNKSIDYQYLASANGQTQVYTVTVMNNWNTGRDELLSYVNQTQYKLHTVTWININNEPIVWIDNSGKQLNWINTL